MNEICRQPFFFIFDMLKQVLLHIFILLAFTLKCQDKLFFLNGQTKSGKVTVITPEYIGLKSDSGVIEFDRSTILLIEFKNGKFDKINDPEKEIIATADKKENFHFKQASKELYSYNRVSINSLALCNADIAAFYERVLPNKKIGLGIMGAYNFNLYANAINPFIAVLANAKKNYDLGGFINFYPARVEKRTFMHCGLMVKYTSFNFTSVRSDSVNVGSVYAVTNSYKASKGNQLATIVTIGSHTDITKNFFIKTIFGIGGFRLKGDYKEQFNIELNKANANNQKLESRSLPKLYLGINLGFKL
ncbi:MAG: hypothetical protein JNJ40_00605 [Bacteroidia bacterium]|nr:hypothetical protein [Bacteroidia bacterium]